MMKNMENNFAQKVIAITFDDGPSVDITPQVLEVLEAQGAKGTFFVIGDRITEESAKYMVAAHKKGHEICNHSWSHAKFTKLTPEQMREEIRRTSDLVSRYIGETPRFFRPPYIDVNQVVSDTVELPMICGYNCMDWLPFISGKRRAKMILKQAKDGAIVLLHDFGGNKNTVEALRILLPALREQGYRFVTVSQLFEAKAMDPSQGVHKICSCVPDDL